MATMEEIGRAQAELVEKEAEALAGLASYLQGAIVELPAASLMAKHFAHMAPRLDAAASRRQGMAHEVWDGLAQLLFEADDEVSG